MKKYDVAVIGAGFGGLSAALTLQSSNLSVILIDSLDKPGGRAYTEIKNGYKFDRGPSIITAPFLIDELFSLSGANRSDYCTFVPVDPYYQVIFDDNTSISHFNDYEKLIENIRQIAPNDIDGVFKFFQHAEKIFQKGFLELGEKNFSSILSMLGVAPQLLRLNAVRPVYSMVSQFVKHPKVRQFLSFHPLLIGGNPFDAAAVYSLINRLERAYGVFHPIGGMGVLADAFYKRFQEIGGTGCLSETVESIDQIDNNEFIITTNNNTVHARKVVVNGDMHNIVSKTLKNSAKPKKLAKILKKSKYSMSAFLMYFGTNKRWPMREQHTIVLGPRYESLLTDIFKRKVVVDDFSFYMHIPTRSDETLVHNNGEIIYVLVPVANLASETDWHDYKFKISEQIKDILDTRFLPGFKQSIIEESIFSPLDFRDTLNSHLGNAFGLEPTLLQTASFRPANKSSEVQNLYFVGANTQPGAGVPGVLLSSRITCRLILNEIDENNQMLTPLSVLPSANKFINQI